MHSYANLLVLALAASAIYPALAAPVQAGQNYPRRQGPPQQLQLGPHGLDEGGPLAPPGDQFPHLFTLPPTANHIEPFPLPTHQPGTPTPAQIEPPHPSEHPSGKRSHDNTNKRSAFGRRTPEDFEPRIHGRDGSGLVEHLSAVNADHVFDQRDGPSNDAPFNALRSRRSKRTNDDQTASSLGKAVLNQRYVRALDMLD